MKQYLPQSQEFLDRLAQEVLIGDGAMGTLLYRRGISLEAVFEHLNIIKPDLVLQVHEDYRKAGSQLLETNTFGANASRLCAVGLEKKVRAINLEGARLARKAAGDAFVAGAVGPLVRPKGDTEELSGSEKEEILREQMESLAEGGVDLFMLETFSDLDDLRRALGIAGELNLPAVAQMAFFEGGQTRGGVSARQAAEHLGAAGASAIGANCGSGPKGILDVLAELSQVSDLPLTAFANSGFPQYVEGRYIYLATPEYFASKGREMVTAGASLIGGCCGTGPEHIKSLSEALSDLKPVRTISVPRSSVPEKKESNRGVPSSKTFLDDWGKRPIIAVELDPPKGFNCDKIMASAAKLAQANVDAITLAENPLARIRMGNLALAHRIQKETGVDVIAHVTCRDRNLIGLHSEMMGADLLGIRNILAVTGDPVSVGGESGASSVFDLNSIGLMELLSSLNEGKSLLGADMNGCSDFLIGGAFNPNLPKMDGQLRRLEKKVAAGARFVQTQPVYSVEIMEEMIERIKPLGVPVLVGILPLVSERNAEFLHNEVPGISLPEEVRARMKGKQGQEGIREGMAIASELVEKGRGVAGGYYLMPPFGKVDVALGLIEVIRSLA